MSLELSNLMQEFHVASLRVQYLGNFGPLLFFIYMNNMSGAVTNEVLYTLMTLQPCLMTNMFRTLKLCCRESLA